MKTKTTKIDKISLSSDSNLSNIFISISSPNWKNSKELTIENLEGIINIKTNNDLNVTSVEYVNQETNPELTPDTYRVNTKTHIAIDDNYLYVWNPKLKKWKRILLSDW